MKKILLTIFISLLLIPVHVDATNKESIINFVNNYQSNICDASTKQMFNSYRITFTRLLKEKDLTEDKLDLIYNHVTSAVNTINNYNICKEADLGKMPKSAKSSVKASLYKALVILYKAPLINSEPDSTTNSSNDEENAVIIDKNNNTINIYQNGNLYNKVDIAKKNFNYVGPSKDILYSLIIITIILLISSILFFIILKKNKKNLNILKDILFSIIIVSLITLPTIYINRENIEEFLEISNMLKETSGNKTYKKIVLNEEHEILSYPSYDSEYAHLKIDELAIDLPIKFGDSKDILIKNIGHTTTSFLPGEGGTIILSGHNSSKLLGNLKDIKSGQKIIITTEYGIFTYEVTKTDIMNSDEYNKIVLDDSKEELILYTCYPFENVLYGSKRFVVTSKLISADWK